MHEKLAEHGITSGGREFQPSPEALAVPSISADDLDELMGGGGQDVATLPAGMSLEEAGGESEDIEESDAGEGFDSDDYEED